MSILNTRRNEERNRALLAEYAEGGCVTTMAAKYKISRDRVHQIIRRDYLTKKSTRTTRSNMSTDKPSADSKQVAGTHYNTGKHEQHWNRLVAMYGIDQTWAYFAFNSTAYMERHRLKHLKPDGTLDLVEAIKDVRKAEHYAAKLAELYEQQLAEQTLPAVLKDIPRQGTVVTDSNGVKIQYFGVIKPEHHGCFGALGCDTGDHEWEDCVADNLTKCVHCGTSKEVSEALERID